MWVIPLAFSLALGYVAMRALLPRSGAGWVDHALAGALGAGFGIGASSCLYFLLLMAGAAHPAVVFGIESLAIAGGVLLVRRRKDIGIATPPASRAFKRTWALALALILAGVIFTSTFLDVVRMNPQGDWDAWAIWNLRAKFLAGGADTWKHAVSPRLILTHPGYPLLTSAWIARGWLLSGAEQPDAVPASLALVFAVSTIVLVVAAAAVARSLSAGLLGGLTLLASTAWQSETSSLYADVPLGFYMLAAIALVAIGAQREDPRRFYASGGAFAAFAAWTKNEGMAFLAVAALALLCLAWLSQKREGIRLWLFFAAGALPLGLAAAGFKLFLAPPGDSLLAQSGAQILQKLADGSRYVLMLKAIAAYTLNFGTWYAHPVVVIALLAICLGLRREGAGLWPRRLPLTVIALMLAIEFGIFLITPNDLTWQLSTSMQRLFVQLWPALVFAVFVNLRTPEDWVASARLTPRTGESS